MNLKFFNPMYGLMLPFHLPWLSNRSKLQIMLKSSGLDLSTNFQIRNELRLSVDCGTKRLNFFFFRMVLTVSPFGFSAYGGLYCGS
jgi:hypothetical protein